MFRKGDYFSPYFRKGDNSSGYFKKGHIGHYSTHGNVHGFIRNDDVDFKENRKAGNHLEKSSR